MNSIVSSPVGYVHLLFSIVALITGLFVLVTEKGTLRHKKVGYVYAVSMIVLNLTSFMIYKLYGKFGIFHWLAVISCVTLLLGMLPVLTKKGNYLRRHISFMYWSVIGLYCAFVAEVFSRLPKYLALEAGNGLEIFHKLVGIGTGLVMMVGAVMFIIFRPVWAKRYYGGK